MALGPDPVGDQQDYLSRLSWVVAPSFVQVSKNYVLDPFPSHYSDLPSGAGTSALRPHFSVRLSRAPLIVVYLPLLVPSYSNDWFTD